MPHAVLLGDSVFDNAVYVPDGPSVTEHLRDKLPDNWVVTLLAVDGDITSDVAEQLRGMPADATHLLLSSGGNDALGQVHLLSQRANTVAEALQFLTAVREDFRKHYRRILDMLLSTNRVLACCTVYDSIPGLEPEALTALAMFNEVILREALVSSTAVVDLRLICTVPGDYSELSSIEPSRQGGEKIASALSRLLLGATTPTSPVSVYT